MKPFKCLRSPEHVIVVPALVQQVDPGAHIVRVVAMGDKLQVEAAAAVHTDAVGVLELDEIDQSDPESRDNDQSEAKVRDEGPMIDNLLTVDPLEVAIVGAALSVRAKAAVPALH